jgi:hypothetical protein
MLVSINQKEFDSLSDSSLIWACIEPTIQKIRGQNASIKEDAYTHLSAGQRALLMFQIMHGHSSTGVIEFYCLIPYLPSKGGIWQELKKAMQYFKDYSMLQLLSEMEGDYYALGEKCLTEGIERVDICINNLHKDSDILISIKQHDAMFHEAILKTIKLIGVFIRSNPSEFVQFCE